MDVGLVRIWTFVFAPFPFEDTRRNPAIINNIRDTPIASLGAFANLVCEVVRFLFVSAEIRIDV